MMLRYRHAEDWIPSPQIPSHLLEDNAKLHCMRSAADRGEHRQAAGAFAQRLNVLARSYSKSHRRSARFICLAANLLTSSALAL
jgi:hypothetical protein